MHCTSLTSTERCAGQAELELKLRCYTASSMPSSWSRGKECQTYSNTCVCATTCLRSWPPRSPSSISGRTSVLLLPQLTSGANRHCTVRIVAYSHEACYTNFLVAAHFSTSTINSHSDTNTTQRP